MFTRLSLVLAIFLSATLSFLVSSANAVNGTTTADTGCSGGTINGSSSGPTGRWDNTSAITCVLTLSTNSAAVSFQVKSSGNKTVFDVTIDGTIASADVTYNDSNTVHTYNAPTKTSGSHTYVFSRGAPKGWFDPSVLSYTIANDTPLETTPPTTPTSFTATGVGDNGRNVGLSWTASTDNVAVTGYEWRKDGGSWNALGVVLGVTDSTSNPGWTSHVYDVRAFDAAGNRSTAATVTYTGVHPTAGHVPSGDPVVHPQCSVLMAAYDNSQHDNMRVYVRCMSPSGDPVSMGDLGANRIDVQIVGWQTKEDKDAEFDPIVCATGEVNTWDAEPTTHWNTSRAAVSFLLGTAASNVSAVGGAAGPENLGCDVLAVGGGHRESIVSGGWYGFVERVLEKGVGALNDFFLGADGCEATGLNSNVCPSGSRVWISKVTEASYPYQEGNAFPFLTPFGGNSQVDNKAYFDIRDWNTTKDGTTAAQWAGGDFPGGDWEVCANDGGVDLCGTGGEWGAGYAVGAGPPGYVPGTAPSPDEPFSGSQNDNDDAGCHFSVLDPSTYLCGLGGVLSKLLGVARSMLGILTGLLTGILNGLKALFIPSSDAMAGWQAQVGTIKTSGVFSLLDTMQNFVTGVFTSSQDEQDCPAASEGSYTNGTSTVGKASPINFCQIIDNAGDDMQSSDWGSKLYVGGKILLFVYFALLWFNRISATAGSQAAI